jgi:hypothetical protein
VAWGGLFKEYAELSAKLGNPIKAMHELRARHAESGAFYRDAPQYLGGRDAIEKYANLASAVARSFSGLTRMATQMNDMHAAKTAELWTDAMKARDLNKMELGNSRAALEQMGFDPETVGRMLMGEASKAEYTDVVRRMAAFTQGSGLRAERSEALNRRWFNTLFPFQSYARNKFAQEQIAREHMVDAYQTREKLRGKPGEEAAKDALYASARLYGRFWAGGLAAGSAALSARALVYLGFAGLFGLWNRWEDDPVGAAREMVEQNFMGGLLGETIKGLDPTSARTFSESIVRTVEPLSIGTDIMSAFGATDSYRDLGPVDRAKKLFMREVPFSRVIANHAMRDITMEAALDHYYKWRAKYAPLGRGQAGKDPTGVSEEFRTHMRKASNALRKDDREGMKVALRKALRLKGGQSVAQSLLGKRIMSGPSWSVLDPASRQHLQDYMGPEFMGELQQYDAILEAFADAVR